MTDVDTGLLKDLIRDLSAKVDTLLEKVSASPTAAQHGDHELRIRLLELATAKSDGERIGANRKQVALLTTVSVLISIVVPLAVVVLAHIIR